MQSGVRSTSKTRKKTRNKKSATRAKGMTSSGGILMLSLAHSIQYADSDTTKKVLLPLLPFTVLLPFLLSDKPYTDWHCQRATSLNPTNDISYLVCIRWSMHKQQLNSLIMGGIIVVGVGVVGRSTSAIFNAIENHLKVRAYHLEALHSCTRIWSN